MSCGVLLEVKLMPRRCCSVTVNVLLGTVHCNTQILDNVMAIAYLKRSRVLVQDPLRGRACVCLGYWCFFRWGF